MQYQAKILSLGYTYPDKYEKFQGKSVRVPFVKIIILIIILIIMIMIMITIQTIIIMIMIIKGEGDLMGIHGDQSKRLIIETDKRYGITSQLAFTCSKSMYEMCSKLTI